MVRKSKCDKDSSQDLENKLNYKLKENEFELEYITPCKVSKYINKLNVNKSTGIDGIGPNFLKMCKDYIVLALTALINVLDKVYFLINLKLHPSFPFTKVVI